MYVGTSFVCLYELLTLRAPRVSSVIWLTHYCTPFNTNPGIKLRDTVRCLIRAQIELSASTSCVLPAINEVVYRRSAVYGDVVYDVVVNYDILTIKLNFCLLTYGIYQTLHGALIKIIEKILWNWNKFINSKTNAFQCIFIIHFWQFLIWVHIIARFINLTCCRNTNVLHWILDPILRLSWPSYHTDIALGMCIHISTSVFCL